MILCLAVLVEHWLVRMDGFLSEYVNKTEKIGGTWTATEKMKHCLIFSHEIFYVNCLMCRPKYSITERSQWNYCYADMKLASQNLAKKLLEKMFDMCFMLVSSTCASLFQTTAWRRFRHSFMLLLMNVCDSRSNSVTSACFNWSTDSNCRQR